MPEARDDKNYSDTMSKLVPRSQYIDFIKDKPLLPVMPAHLREDLEPLPCDGDDNVEVQEEIKGPDEEDLEIHAYS